MAKQAQLPSSNGYYLEVDTRLDGSMLLWERTIDPLSWHGDDTIWQFYSNGDWHQTEQDDVSMSSKPLLVF
jgi:hypothetical protein